VRCGLTDEIEIGQERGAALVQSFLKTPSLNTMPIRTQLWTVSDHPTKMAETKLSSEKSLEKMIVHSPEMLSDQWMLIGQQVIASHAGIIDLLALTRDGSLVLIELKRDRTPREVVAQALDYASWVQKLQSENIFSIYQKFKPGADLANDFSLKFGALLEDDSLNQSHQVIIVASSLDDSTARIVSYLSDWDIPINVLCFQVFGTGDRQILSRTWLLDPAETQVNAANVAMASDKEPWNGEYYCSFKDDASRSWDEAVNYGFFCAGGGSWYTNTLRLLEPGKRIWVNAVGSGYVGVGHVSGEAVPARSFLVNTSEGQRPALSILKASYHRDHVDDDELCEYFVPVEWLQTVPLEQAVKMPGLFGNQNSVCRPRTVKWQSTIEYLRGIFYRWDERHFRS
jgi:hypothetical protein